MTAVSRRIGRPRLVEPALDIAPIEHILLEAGRLFTEHGYRATTTRQIAEAVGLRQGSLYHYFKHKEDILAELLHRIADRALEVSAWMAHQDASAVAKVWAFAYLDVANYLAGPHRIASLVRLAEAHEQRFDGFWAKSAQVQAAYEALLVRARDDGALAFDDLSLTGSLLYGLANGPVDWFDPAHHDRVEVARLTARAILLSVLADPASLPVVIAEGEQLAVHAPHAPQVPNGCS